MAYKTVGQVQRWWILMGVLCVLLAGAAAATLLSKRGDTIDSFQACKDAGGAVMESYQEKCMMNGKSFTNEAQSVDSDVSGYIGLAEQAALDKAAANNKAARVVERDGESLPVTMDFMPGRLNLSVKDSNIYKVQVEGEED